MLKPFADFNYVVAIPQTAPVPPSKDTGTNYQLHPMSTGPYKFQSYQLNKQLTLVPNPQWNPATDPYDKQLASKIIVNLNVNQADIDNRLLAGDVQVDAQAQQVQVDRPEREAQDRTSRGGRVRATDARDVRRRQQAREHGVEDRRQRGRHGGQIGRAQPAQRGA